MNEASLYKRVNDVQRRDAKRVMEDFAKVMQWRQDGCDSLIDIGSGSGDVLMDLVHPLLPQNFELLVGSDISEKMVSHANQCYSDGKRIKFEVLDISSDELPKHLAERFDHVTSFYCLHRVRHQLKMLQNIYALLRKNGGDCLLVFPATHLIVYDAYKSLAENTKWSIYMRDYKNFTSPYQESADPVAEFSQLLQQTGFTDFKVDIQTKYYTFEGLKSTRDFVRAVCPFIGRIPVELHEEFLDDFIKDVESRNPQRREENSSQDFIYAASYKLLIAYVCKTDGILKSVLSERNHEKSIN